MAISDWPLAERPREKLLCKGAGALSDAELLAIFLRTGVRGKTAVDLARDVLHAAGGLRALLGTDQAGFCQMKGLGVAKFVQLQAVLEIARRYLLENLQRDTVLSSPRATRDYTCAAAHWLAARSVCLLVRRCAEPITGIRGIVCRNIGRRQRLPARSAQTRSLPQCGGGHFRAQPPVWHSGAEPG